MKSERNLIWFKNDGELDPLSLTTLGASVKETGSAIGYFGTGLKFAFASLMRMNAIVEVWIGETKYAITKTTQKIRGQKFDLVYVGGERSGFTTQLGRDWKPWMAYRELHSNALDEPGSEIKYGEAPNPMSGMTLIKVWHPDFVDEYHSRDKTFLSTEPLAVVPGLEIHPGKGTSDIFYRGVNVGKMRGEPTLFTYNLLTGIKLTEDRTSKNYEFEIETQRLVQKITDKDVLYDILTASEAYAEKYFEYGSGLHISKPFMNVIDRILSDSSIDHDALQGSVQRIISYRLNKTISGIKTISLSSDMEAQLIRAKTDIKSMKIPVKEYPVVVVESLGSCKYGLAKDGKAYLARSAFQNGQKFLTITLLEEWFHLTTGFADYSRDMQDWLFNELVSMWEKNQ